MQKIAVLHILPLEYYPPVTNLLDILGQNEQFSTVAYSSHNQKNRTIYQHKNITIHRTSYPAYVKGKFNKIVSLLKSIFAPLRLLIKSKPDIVIYFEPHSAYPAYLYKRYFNPSVRIFIHYHEYYSPKEFTAPQMKSVQFFHKREVSYLYKKAEWISQTNTSRLEFFFIDYPFISEKKLFTLANYPPRSWSGLVLKKQKSSKIRFLYLGALSFENTYIQEIVDFVAAYPNDAELDVYSFNAHDDVVHYFENSKHTNIRYFKDGIDYQDIPAIACNYDVGLILYTGHNINYTYNAPNKLFEYLGCGLTVWYPKELLGCSPYQSSKVRAVNFKKLNKNLLLIQHKTESSDQSAYFCDTELARLIEKF